MLFPYFYYNEKKPEVSSDLRIIYNPLRLGGWLWMRIFSPPHSVVTIKIKCYRINANAVLMEKQTIDNRY
jgi:hypothetical protein